MTELRSLAGGYEGGRLCLVDNVVSPAFLRVVLPKLAADPLPIPLFLDVPCGMIPLPCEAGITRMQPFSASLSSIAIQAETA